MIGRIVVMRPADFVAWLAAGPAQPSLAQYGFALFRALGCSGCHAAGSTVHAPSLERPARARRCTCRMAAAWSPTTPTCATRSCCRAQDVVAGYRAGHAVVRRAGQRRGHPRRCIAYLRFDGRDAGEHAATGAARSYLDDGLHACAPGSTSTDHKRIAILYAIGITGFFFIGGAAATLIRLELATPAGDLVSRRHLQQALHRARRDHGVAVPDPVDPVGARQLPAAADDRRARPGLSAAEPARAGTSTWPAA